VRIRLPYQVSSDPLNGRLASVFLNVLISNPHNPVGKCAPVQAIIDSGASGCVFDARLGRMIGLDVKAGHRTVAVGIGGETDVWTHDVRLHILGGPVIIRAGFQENLPVAGLLGMGGFFEHFRITFDGVDRHCDLERLFKL
jgi:hypothetical protein